MPLNFQPPLLNSANPWATTKADLEALYESQYTGAVTVRTSLLEGFAHDSSIHQYLFYDARSNTPTHVRSPRANSSLNTLGYSPTTLPEYLQIIESIVRGSRRSNVKPFVVSVTGGPGDIVECHRLISSHAARTMIPLPMEINLSCPNIADKPPPAYSGLVLREYLFALQKERAGRGTTAPIGIKTPPYTYADQFTSLVDALLATTEAGLTCPIDFITATNTLGNCLVMSERNEIEGSYAPSLASASGTGIGGVGGAAIHALSLGNVQTLRSMLDKHPSLKHIEIIGVGGVADSDGYARMKNAGASYVAVGTALGKDGIAVFEKIGNEIKLSMVESMESKDGPNGVYANSLDGAKSS